MHALSFAVLPRLLLVRIVYPNISPRIALDPYRTNRRDTCKIRISFLSGENTILGLILRKEASQKSAKKHFDCAASDYFAQHYYISSTTSK